MAKTSTSGPTRARITTARGLTLMASTSLMALAMTAAPVSLHFQLDKPILKVAQADDSCFVAGTMIRMADGTEKPIESVAAGDLVMGRNGRANRVQTVERPLLGARRLYALNGGPAFVTAEHPFMTRTGWMSIEPAATAAENRSLEVGRLAVGAQLAVLAPDTARAVGNLALAAAAELALVFVTLERIEAREADSMTRLYNLLLDGDHAYFANGYLVHNKDGGGEGDGGGGGGSGGGGGGDGGEGGGGGDGGSGGDGSEGHGSESHGGESGSSGESGGSGESGESGHSAESGESGHSSDSGESGGDRGFGGVEQDGPDLSHDEEAGAIAGGWE